jgi:hypothetical protein
MNKFNSGISPALLRGRDGVELPALSGDSATW